MPRSLKILGGPWCLCALVVVVLALAGCGSLQVEAGFRQPADLTATAIAQAAPTPTPKPQLGRLAFVRGGDVWVKELPDGEARRLTWDGRNSEPNWSASGEWLAFRKDHQVWTVRADGSGPAAVGKGTMAKGFAWSPAEGLLAYTTGVGSLWVARAGDPNEVELVRQGSGREGTGVNDLAWSPDGAWIAFDSVHPTGDNSQFLQQVRLVHADGSGSKVVRESRGAERDFLAGWSPDGQWLLFWQGSYSASLKSDGFPLRAMPATGGTPVQLSETMLTYQDFLSWSPDGGRLALVDGGGRMAWERKAILVATQAGATQRLSDQGRNDLFPAWSPDGRLLAFTSAPEAPGLGGGDPAKQAMARRKIWIMQPDGSDKRQLTSDPRFRDERPQWSAHGDYLLFGRLQDEQAQLWLMRSDGSGLRQVVDELTPSPGWFGYHGYLNWGGLYNWWTGLPSGRK